MKPEWRYNRDRSNDFSVRSTAQSSVAPPAIAAENPHLGRFDVDSYEGGHTATAKWESLWAGRREADVVTTSSL
jgi:hypothetical protein